MVDIDEYMKSTGVSMEDTEIPGLYLKSYLDLVEKKASPEEAEKFFASHGTYSSLKKYPVKEFYDLMIDSVKAIYPNETKEERSYLGGKLIIENFHETKMGSIVFKVIMRDIDHFVKFFIYMLDSLMVKHIVGDILTECKQLTVKTIQIKKLKGHFMHEDIIEDKFIQGLVVAVSEIFDIEKPTINISEDMHTTEYLISWDGYQKKND